MKKTIATLAILMLALFAGSATSTFATDKKVVAKTEKTDKKCDTKCKDAKACTDKKECKDSKDCKDKCKDGKACTDKKACKDSKACKDGKACKTDKKATKKDVPTPTK